jgi:dTDP-L-rhamnose 4-epimerase
MFPSIGPGRPNGKRDARRVDWGGTDVHESAPQIDADQFRIVVPVLDEAAALPALLAELQALDLLRHTIFVDNGSTDEGPAQIEQAGAVLLREPRRGYGYPCLTGARAALQTGAAVVIFMEADGTDDPSEAPVLAAPVLAGRADLVIGSRRAAVHGRQGHMPLHQRLGNDWLALALWVLFGLRLSDDGPFRAVSGPGRGGGGAGGGGGPGSTRLALEERAYAFPTEMAVKARLLNARILVVDTPYRLRSGRSKIAGTWRGSLLAVRDITWCLARLRLCGFRTGEATPRHVRGWLC